MTFYFNDFWFGHNSKPIFIWSFGFAMAINLSYGHVGLCIVVSLPLHGEVGLRTVVRLSLYDEFGF